MCVYICRYTFKVRCYIIHTYNRYRYRYRYIYILYIYIYALDICPCMMYISSKKHLWMYGPSCNRLTPSRWSKTSGLPLSVLGGAETPTGFHHRWAGNLQKLWWDITKITIISGETMEKYRNIQINPPLGELWNLKTRANLLLKLCFSNRPRCA